MASVCYASERFVAVDFLNPYFVTMAERDTTTVYFEAAFDTKNDRGAIISVREYDLESRIMIPDNVVFYADLIQE